MLKRMSLPCRIPRVSMRFGPSQRSFRYTHLGMSQAHLWTGCLYCLGLYTILATHSAILIEDRRHFPKVSHQSLRVLTPVLHLLTSCLALAYPRLPKTVPRLVPPTPFPLPPGCCSGQHLPRQASLDLCTLHPPHTHMASKRPQSSDFSSYNRTSDINLFF